MDYISLKIVTKERKEGGRKERKKEKTNEVI
jgi:hypothetical protein